MIVIVSWGEVASADVLNVDLSHATVGGQVPISAQFLPDVLWINFYVDGQYGTSTGGSAGTFNWNSTGTADGIHNVVAVGYDANNQVSGYSDIKLNAANSGSFAPAGSVDISGYGDPTIDWLNLYIDSSYTQSTAGSTWSVSPSFGAGTHNVRISGYYNSDVVAAEVQVSSLNFGNGGGTSSSADSTPSGSSTPSDSTGPSYFSAIPPGGNLPTEAQCASWVLSTPSDEPTPSNSPYNNTTPTASELSAMHQQPTWNPIEPASDFANVTGDFVGTTTQIIRWAACKWGIDENWMKADAYWQSTNSTGKVIWDQSTIWDWRSDPSDCSTPGWNGWGMYANFSTGSTQGCYQSYGIFQLKVKDYNAWSEALDSTSFNADFRGALWRGCINGNIASYVDQDPQTNWSIPYLNSDLNTIMQGCAGINASGHWYDSGATSYIATLQNLLSYTPWPAT